MAKYYDETTVINAFTKGTQINPTWVKGILATTKEADVAPVVHGHWLLEREPNGKPYCFHCSVCDNDFHYIGIETWYDYCPLCGARMDEEVRKDGTQ